MKFYKKVLKGIKKILKKAKLGIIVAVATASAWFLVSGVLELAPSDMSPYVKIIIGLSVLILIGFWGYGSLKS